MVATNTNQYDIVIMGAGFAGVCQARHLLKDGISILFEYAQKTQLYWLLM